MRSLLDQQARRVGDEGWGWGWAYGCACSQVKVDFPDMVLVGALTLCPTLTLALIVTTVSTVAKPNYYNSPISTADSSPKLALNS